MKIIPTNFSLMIMYIMTLEIVKAYISKQLVAFNLVYIKYKLVRQYQF